LLSSFMLVWYSGSRQATQSTGSGIQQQMQQHLQQQQARQLHCLICCMDTHSRPRQHLQLLHTCTTAQLRSLPPYTITAWPFQPTNKPVSCVSCNNEPSPSLGLAAAAESVCHHVPAVCLQMITKLFPVPCNVYARGPVGENVMHVAMLLNTPSTLAITRYLVKLYGRQLVNCPIQVRMLVCWCWYGRVWLGIWSCRTNRTRQAEGS
jgi:hypothetical protein